MARVICPFCLKAHDFRSSPICPQHQIEVPAVYVNDYSRVPPLWLVTIGFSRHGKSCYLAALTRTLEEISKVWEGVYYRPLDEYTFKAIQKIRRDAETGVQPDKNTINIPRPLLFNVYDMPRAGSRCLVMYDVAGEIYDSLSNIKDYVTSIKQVTTTWFLVSLSDLETDSQGKTITDLFSVYLSGMEKLRADLRERNLIVIYTKGDKFSPADHEIRNYLMSDPLLGLLSPDKNWETFQGLGLEGYLGDMREMSKKLEEYTRRRVKGGAAFMSMVRASGMNLAFSVVSALGSDPDQPNQMSIASVPRRVIDPFLWAITLERGPTSASLSLVLDVESEDNSPYSDEFPVRLADSLSDYGDLTTYYLGQSRPVSLPGQDPPTHPPRAVRPRLIGPILDSMEPGTRCLIISSGPIIDLADYARSRWRNSLLIATMDQTQSQDWVNTMSYRSGDDLEILTNALMRLEPGV